MKPVKLDKQIVDILLPRLSDEFKAAYTYRAIQNWCANVGHFKAAEYFAKESADELEHAKGIEDFLVQWNVIPQLPQIDVPTLEYKDLSEVLTSAYELEYNLYEAYEEDTNKILKIGDTCVYEFLTKYLKIQTASVAEYSDKLNILEGVEKTKFNFLLLEEKLF